MSIKRCSVGSRHPYATAIPLDMVKALIGLTDAFKKVLEDSELLFQRGNELA